MLRAMAILVFPFFGMILAMSCESAEPRTTKLGDKDAHSTVNMQVGDILEISLKGNPTTGYEWKLASANEAMLKQVGKPGFKSKTGLIGSGGTVTMRFEAVGAGETPLKLIYHRPFEKDAPPAKVFEATVVIKK